MAEISSRTQIEPTPILTPTQISSLLLTQELEQEPDPNDIHLSLEELRNKYSATIIALIKNNHYHISEYTSYKVLIHKNAIRKLYFGLCQDCATLNILRETEACATGFTCCTKEVCWDDCLVYCSSGHLNTYYNCQDELTFPCDICNEEITPKCIWHGISNAEYERRYG